MRQAVQVALVSPNAGFSSAAVGADFARMINSSVADGNGFANAGAGDHAFHRTRRRAASSRPLVPLRQALVIPRSL